MAYAIEYQPTLQAMTATPSFTTQTHQLPIICLLLISFELGRVMGGL